jgi:hypothetical protein
MPEPFQLKYIKKEKNKTTIAPRKTGNDVELS